MPTKNKHTSKGARAMNPARHIRISDELWVDSVQQAADDGVSISEAVRALLRGYARGDFKI